MNCDICDYSDGLPHMGFCPQCGWDFAENPAKVALFRQVVQQKQALQLQKKHSELSILQDAKVVKQVDKKMKRLTSEQLEMEQTLQAAQQQLEHHQVQVAKLNRLREHASSLNYLLDALKHSHKDTYQGRTIDISRNKEKHHEFLIEANFAEKPALLLVLGRTKTMATDAAECFLNLDEAVQRQAHQWQVTIPKIDFLKGTYWGFFTTFHSQTKAIIDPLIFYKFEF